MTASGRYPAYAGLAVAGLGLVVLVGGWLLDVALLRSVLPGQATMKVNTALCFLLLGTATWLLGIRRGRRVAWGLAAVAGIVGSATLFEDLTDVGLGIDELVVEDTGSAFTPDPGRMSPATALGFMAASAALLSMHPRLPWIRPEQQGAVVVAGIAFTALGGYLFGAAPFFGATRLTTGMALHTALSFAVLSSGIVLLRPDAGWVALFLDPDLIGQTARRLVPTILIVPVVTAVVARIGIGSGWWDRGFALSLQLIANVGVLAGVVAWGLRRLSGSDTARRDALAQLQRLNVELEERVAARTEALAEERHRFATLAGGAPVGIFHADAAGRRDYINPRWSDITGMPREEALGMGWVRSIHPEDRDGVLAAWRTTTASEQDFHETFRHLRPDGEVRWVVSRAAPVQDGDHVTGYVGTVEDISDRVELERRLRDLAQTRDAILSASQDHIYVYDRRMRYTYANPAGPATLGMRPEDMVGRTWRELGMPADAMEPFEEHVKRVFRDGQPLVDRTPYPIDGQRRWYEYALAPVLDDGGDVRRVVSVTRDITDRVRSEEAARVEAGRQLEMERLEAETAFKTDFLNRAAHELATPLTPISLQVAILERHLSSDPKARTGLERIGRNVQRLERLVDDLLHATKIQSARWHLDRGPQDVSDLVRHAVDRRRRDLERRSIHVHLDLEPAGVEADADRVMEVMDNLLSNAAKFTPRNGHVWLRTRTRDEDVLVEVRDDGRGIDPDDAGRLFTPFAQAHDTMQVSEPGTGLGLYICKGIVEAHGGTIGIESEGRDRGARAWFTLPLQAPEAEHETPAEHGVART